MVTTGRAEREVQRTSAALDIHADTDVHAHAHAHTYTHAHGVIDADTGPHTGPYSRHRRCQGGVRVGQTTRPSLNYEFR